jgi:hypothetical protein
MIRFHEQHLLLNWVTQGRLKKLVEFEIFIEEINPTNYLQFFNLSKVAQSLKYLNDNFLNFEEVS